MNSEIEIKTERLCKMLAAADRGAVLIGTQHNFAWLTGGKSNAINQSVEAGACSLLVRADGKRFVLANNIELQRLLTEQISQDDFEPVEFAWQAEKSARDYVLKKARTVLSNDARIAADTPVHPSVEAIENLIAPCRYSLTVEEIARYRMLGADASAVLDEVFHRIAPGATELEIARLVKNALLARQIDSVVTLVGADERIERYRHPLPTENVWRKTLLIVVCARRAGLIASLSRIAVVGAIPGELAGKTEAAARVYAKMTAATEVGATGARLYETAAQAYAAENCPDEINQHHQGGAAGYKPREWVAHPASNETVFVNQAFAWNPTITGTKAEETFVLTENGAEIITASKKFPRVRVTIDGREFHSPGILNL